MEIKVLGAGCAKCNQLEALVKQTLQELGKEANVEKVTDFPTIMSFGVMATPALVVDGKVKVSGRIPSAAEVKSFLG
ncbi:redox-active disulfide protein 2, putative [Heliomicrobium modesticaldum Ice1]|uniref:Redox-active disulfide protein 2, putative n=1 Tax=Heliobacterium modesticaldum (strain ATCC 51547 / Ice1) TaxID=498761 RepID=B0TB48_HELMI|nr:thioredoxin family protein [Heliomicrobium modesticaldum]ABZ83775.1 redox-active disulfide protein 2, putative [Heliomicrobium modesticaldum Ice1]